MPSNTSICDVIKWFILGMLGIYALLFLVSRVHILHESYTHMAQMREDDQWLYQSCKNPEFYSNLKTHSTLCDEVNEKRRSVLLLMALQRVIDKTHLCGYTECSVMLIAFADWALGRGLFLCVFLLVLLAVLPVVVFPLWRNFINHRADLRVNAPFGRIHFAQTHPHAYETSMLQTSPIYPAISDGY